MIANFQYLNSLTVNIVDKDIYNFKEIILGGSRKSGKTLSIVEFLINNIIYGFTKEKKYAVLVFRKEQKDIHDSIWTEYKNKLEQYEINYFENQTRYKIFYNSSIITFHSLHDRNQKKKKLSGFASLHKYNGVFIHLEEAHEYNQADIEDIKEAIRGNDNIVWIYSFNPWSLSTYIVNRANTFLPFNLNQLKTNFYQIVTLKDKLVHYTNYKINELLPQTDKDYLNELEKLNPNRALTACYGYYGIEQGTIYSHTLDKISNYIPKERLYWYAGGIDFGFRQDATCLILIGTEQNFNTLNVLKEYYHTNKSIIFKSNVDMVIDIINVIKKFLEQYQPTFFTYIYCDTSNYTMIELLNQYGIKMGISNKVYFKPCTKIEVALRVGLQLGLLENERVNVDKACINFYKELGLARWDENKTGLKIKDIDNHSQDALHYAFTPWFNYFKKKINPLYWKKTYTIN